MPVTQVNMVNLANLDSKLTVNRAFNFVFGLRGPKKRPSAQLANSLVRLTDKTIHEHQLAQKELADFVKRQSIISFFRAQGHLENCILSLSRAINFADVVKKAGLRLPDGSPLIPRGNIELMSTRVRHRIKNLRDAIVHGDERVIKSAIKAGNPIALNPDNNGLSLEGISVTYEELGRWLRQLHALAVRINQYQEQ